MTRSTVVFTILCFAFALLLSGCIQSVLPHEEAVLITDPFPMQVREGQVKYFRINLNGSTPEYTIHAVNVGSVSAVFEVDPGDKHFGMYEGDTDYIDLSGDNRSDIKVTLTNITSGVAMITIDLSGGVGECPGLCEPGEVQAPYPDCSCSPASVDCPNTCQSGESQRPYPDCSCFVPVDYCSDGTAYSACSATKPRYCDNLGNLVNKCSICGCPSGQSCNTTTEECYTAPVACSTACAPGESQKPYPDCSCYTPSGGETDQAIEAANVSTEGLLMARFESQYAKSKQCTEDEFKSKFNARNGKDPSAGQIAAFSSTKNAVPGGVEVEAENTAGSSYEVVYSTTGGTMSGPALKMMVSLNTGITTGTWLDGSDTSRNTQLLNTAEGIGGNCGFIMAINGW